MEDVEQRAEDAVPGVSHPGEHGVEGHRLPVGALDLPQSPVEEGPEGHLADDDGLEVSLEIGPGQGPPDVRDGPGGGGLPDVVRDHAEQGAMRGQEVVGLPESFRQILHHPVALGLQKR